MRCVALGQWLNEQAQPYAIVLISGRQRREGVASLSAPVARCRFFNPYSGLMLAACMPFGPRFVSKLTF